MMLSFDDWAPEFDIPGDGSLLLFLDSTQIESCAQKLFEVEGEIDVEPIYILEPFDELLEVSPYVVRVTPQIMSWFYSQQTPTAGFFFTSKQSIEAICCHFRHAIKVRTPYDRDVFFKMAHSEVAWVMLKNDVTHYWAMIDQAWLPTRVGWKILTKPDFVPEALKWPLQLTDRLWQQLSQVTWMNTLQAITLHLEAHFPALIAQDEYDAWLNATASEAYQLGFNTERDLLFYFNIIGWLGEEAVSSEQYPDIHQLVFLPSLETPSQRIEQASELAYRYFQSPSVSQEFPA